MAVAHTSGVRLEAGNAFTGSPRLCKTGDMRPIKNSFFKFFPKNYHNFSLHDHKTGDINPIVKINVSAGSQRHCSTTFYQ